MRKREGRKEEKKGRTGVRGWHKAEHLKCVREWGGRMVHETSGGNKQRALC